MIRRRAAARSPLLVGVPVVFVATVLLLPSRELVDGRYPPAFSGWSSTGMVAAGAVSATCACWSTSRLRRAGWLARRWRRRTDLIVMRSSVLVGAVIAATVYAGAVLAAGFQGVFGIPASQVWVPMTAILVGWAVLGASAGAARVLPIPLALIAAIIVPYVATVFPPAVEPLWLRHLTGYWPDCCTATDSVDPRASVAAVMMSLALVGLGASTLGSSSGRRTPSRWAVLVGTVALAGVSLLVVSGLGASPTVVRPADELRCSGSPSACLWPEHQRLRSVVERGQARSTELLRILGLSAPDVITERPARNAVVIVADDRDTPASIAAEAVRGRIFRDVSPCTTRVGAAAVAAAELERIAASAASVDPQTASRPIDTSTFQAGRN